MILAVILVGCLLPVTAAAIAPPKVIAERNLEADFIAVGEVVSVNADNTPPYFVLNVGHVIKGLHYAGKDAHVKVLLDPQPLKQGKIAAHSQGILPVKVKTGSLVIVYLEPSPSHPLFFKPLLQGLSVVTIGMPSHP